MSRETDRVAMLKKFVLGQRRPWVLDSLSLPDGRKIPLDHDFHDAVIKKTYSDFFEGQKIIAAAGNYTFQGGDLEVGRGFLMNNCEPLSLTDWHAEQLQEQLRRIRQTKKKIKRYAIIGTDASLGQSLNVYHLQKDVEIHVFEQNIKSIECASFTAEKMGLGGVFNFHHGDAAIELPKVAKQIGEFDMLEMMLVLQHLRGDSFRIFLEGVLSALKTGGLLKINELMIRTLGSVKIHDNSAEVSSLSAEKIIGKYFRGDDNLQTPSFLRVGWDWPKGHAWFNGGEMIKDIFSCTDKRLALRDEFTLSLPEGEFFYGDPLRWTGYRYVIVSLAAAMAAQANSLKSVSGQEAAAERVARLAAWAFEDGWKVDNLLTSNAFKERKFSVNFSEVVGVILEKTA